VRLAANHALDRRALSEPRRSAPRARPAAWPRARSSSRAAPPYAYDPAKPSSSSPRRVTRKRSRRRLLSLPTVLSAARRSSGTSAGRHPMKLRMMERAAFQRLGRKKLHGVCLWHHGELRQRRHPAGPTPCCATEPLPAGSDPGEPLFRQQSRRRIGASARRCSARSSRCSTTACGFGPSTVRLAQRDRPRVAEPGLMLIDPVSVGGALEDVRSRRASEFSRPGRRPARDGGGRGRACVARLSP